MSSKAPSAGIVSPASSPTITDISAGRIWMLQTADELQHALATAWGGPASWADMRLTEGTSCELRIQVPPSVMEFDLRFLVSGVGRLTVTTSNDATGTQIEWVSWGGDDVASATLVSTVGSLPSSAGASSARAVTVRSSTGWGWASETLTVSSASGANLDGTIYGVLLVPLYVSTAV